MRKTNFDQACVKDNIASLLFGFSKKRLRQIFLALLERFDMTVEDLK